MVHPKKQPLLSISFELKQLREEVDTKKANLKCLLMILSISNEVRLFRYDTFITWRTNWSLVSPMHDGHTGVIIRCLLSTTEVIGHYQFVF